MACPFSPTLALELAHCCQTANESPTLFVVVEFGDFRVLAFRASEDLADWIADADVQLTTHPAFPGRVHNGFADRALAFMPWVNDHKVMLAGKPFYLTGHSLGGAIASLVSWKMTALGLLPADAYTFGSPRVGDSTFAAAAQPEWRVVDEFDIVPELPPWLGYSQLGSEVRLKIDGTIRFGKTLGEWLKAERLRWQKRGQARRHNGHVNFDFLAMHLIADYIYRLEHLK